MTDSYFAGGDRRSTLKSISKDLHDKNRLVVTTNDQPDDVDLVPTKTEDPAYLAIDREHNKKLREDDATLEGLKRGLQADPHTQHPNKFMAASGAGSHSLSNLHDVRQNIFTTPATDSGSRYGGETRDSRGSNNLTLDYLGKPYTEKEKRPDSLSDKLQDERVEAFRKSYTSA